ncbi:HAD-IA family hydrolase [Rhodobacteraceae bacterium MYP1-1]|uniref:phosphoglycolate phosphatase n=2 Tax=Halocynthiibacter styelae TaxID=2761955 RepID=A0A8J7LVN0_9RHOB|nr:HAD-IA family hydrolase [Paenihalocynthiibacter styelae]
MRTVVFDLDGTLADTGADLIHAANACFGARGLGDLLDPEADKGIGMKGGRAMLTAGFTRQYGAADEAMVLEDYPRLLEYYAENIDVYTRMFPGAVDAITRLRNAGYAVGICTNKPEGLAETLLSRLGVRDLFDALIGADTLSERKPHPMPLIETVKRLGGDISRTVQVGDTITDHKTARACNVASLLVTFGPDGEKVNELQPDALLTDYEELQDVVADLIG